MRADGVKYRYKARLGNGATAEGIEMRGRGTQGRGTQGQRITRISDYRTISESLVRQGARLGFHLQSRNFFGIP